MGLYNESDGTLKSILLYILARVAILNDKSLFIDELNDRLHPLLLKYIIDLFYESDSMAQLIYTTHDTTLMDKKFFSKRSNPVRTKKMNTVIQNWLHYRIIKFDQTHHLKKIIWRECMGAFRF